MGFKIIFKLISEAAGILIVIAAVVIFSYFDPFGWFTPDAKIQNTAVLVREIKEIGQLISAEYYGEALASWPTIASEDYLSEDTAEVKRIVRNINLHLQNESEKDKWETEDDDDGSEGEERSKKEVNRLKRKMWRFYKKSIRRHYKSSDIFDYVLIAAFKKQTKQGTTLKTDRNGKLAEKSLSTEESKSCLLFLYDSDAEEIFTEEELQQISIDFRKNPKHTPKDERRKDAVCIGRGIIRAGIDLSRLRESNISFHQNGEAFISNVDVKVLYAELNPWFIPQRKVKGFEILKLKGKISSSDISRLKKLCEDQIMLQAEDRHILQEAKTNAEEALLNFFNLVRTSQLKKVTIIDNAFDELRMKYDTIRIIEATEALIIYNRSFSYYKNLVKKDSIGNSEKTKAVYEWFSEEFLKKQIQVGAARRDSGAYSTYTIGNSPWLLLAMKRYKEAASDSVTKFTKTEKFFIKNCLPDPTQDLDTAAIKANYQKIDKGEIGI